MALDVRIISGGSTYYLVNSSGTPTAGGAATGASTTPYSIQGAKWTQTATPRLVTYAGGPPFGVGARPVYAGFDNVTESIEIGVRGSSSDNVISLIRQLRQIMNTALFSLPAVLYWQPNGATSPAYFEIYSADVQETGDWLNPATGFTDALCRVTWTRSALGGRLTTGETVVNAVSYTNQFSGSPLAYAAMSAGAGELIYDGQPLNVAITGTYSSPYIGSIDSVISKSTVQSVTTSSTTGAGSGAADSLTIGTGFQTKRGLKLRLFALINGTPGDQTEFQLRITNGSASIYTSPWVGRPSFTGQMFDMGTMPLDWAYNTGFTSVLFELWVRSVNGTSRTLTLSNVYGVYYYTLGRIQGGLGSDEIVLTFQESSNRVCLPLPRPVVYNATLRGVWVGTAPRYYSGASLMCLARVSYGITGQQNTWSAQTCTVTATQAPMYHTLRGNG